MTVAEQEYSDFHSSVSFSHQVADCSVYCWQLGGKMAQY